MDIPKYSQLAISAVALSFVTDSLIFSVAAETPAAVEPAKKPEEIPATGALKLPEALHAAGFKIFGELVAKSSLADKLGDRQFTCFAPSDEAFAVMSPEKLAALKNDDNQAQRLRWLESHFVTDGIFKKADLLTFDHLKSMVEGGTLVMWVNIEDISINRISPLVSPDIPAKNGIIHGLTKLVVAEDDNESTK